MIQQMRGRGMQSSTKTHCWNSFTRVHDARTHRVLVFRALLLSVHASLKCPFHLLERCYLFCLNSWKILGKHKLIIKYKKRINRQLTFDKIQPSNHTWNIELYEAMIRKKKKQKIERAHDKGRKIWSNVCHFFGIMKHRVASYVAWQVLELVVCAVATR